MGRRMRFVVSAHVRDAPGRVYAWWTDYGPAGHRETVSHGLGWTQREVVARDGDRVVLKERALGVPLMTHRLELHPARLALRESADAFDAWWTFEPAADGTTVRREVEVRSRAGGMVPQGLLRWGTQRDLDHHAREYERERREDDGLGLGSGRAL